MTLRNYFITMKVLATIILIVNRATGQFNGYAGAFDGILIYVIWRCNLN